MASTAFMAPPLARTMSAMDSSQIPMTMEDLMNQKAGAMTSIYQICQDVKKRLWQVPGMDQYLARLDNEDRLDFETHEIVTDMWNLFREGFPLITLFNALGLEKRIFVDINTVTESKRMKAAAFKFLQGCLEVLKFDPGECFLITDLYSEDTAGLVKVLRVVNRVLDILEQNNRLIKKATYQQDPYEPIDEPQKVFYSHIIDELVSTERSYVLHLDTLQQTKNELMHDGGVSRDIYHAIFMNLDALLDHQRRFLIRVEQMNGYDLALQNWGHLFKDYAHGFRLYEPFIVNQFKSINVLEDNWDKIRLAKLSPRVQAMVSGGSNQIAAFLLKPFQRLTKYPLLLESLLKAKDFPQEKMRDVRSGKAAIDEILIMCNTSAGKQKNADDVVELESRVDDWKGHKLERFGLLLISGKHTVLKTDAASKADQEREYQMYLFECILLCCKEVNLNKPKNRLTNRNIDKKGKPRLQLKGRIFMQNVTNVVSFVDEKTSKDKPFQLQIFWKGDPAIESFQISFSSEETRNEWFHKTADQVKAYCKSPGDAALGWGTTSQTEFVYLNGANLENPYRQEEDNEDLRLSNGSTLYSSTQEDYAGSTKNGSTTSLRSRSATGGSGGRSSNASATAGLNLRGAAPARFPLPEPGFAGMNPPLKLSTSFIVSTPDDVSNTSYFSPTVQDSPTSFRSSTISSQATSFTFNRHASPSHNRSQDGSKHNTAPPGTYQDRHSQRPQVPGGPQNAAIMATSQPRSRSLSSPDIQNQNSPSKRYMSPQMGGEDVPVPPIPSHMLPIRGQVNRSQTNSPNGNPYIRSESRQGAAMGPGPTSHGISQRMISPPPHMTSPMLDNTSVPYQLKVRITCNASYVTIVVPSNIKYQTLADRIDAKMEKITKRSIRGRTARLRWLDDDSFISVMNDEDVKLVFDEWKSLHENTHGNGEALPDVELMWHEGDDLILRKRAR